MTDPAPRKSYRRLVVTVLVVAAGLLLGGVVFLLTRPSAEEPMAPAPATPSSAVVEAEGRLQVGSGEDALEVPQLPCTVEGGAFECDDPAELVTVQAPAGELSLMAGVSETFTVSTVPLSGEVAPVAASGGVLEFSDAPVGEYSVTVLGEEQDGRRASWQFVLEVLEDAST